MIDALTDEIRLVRRTLDGCDASMPVNPDVLEDWCCALVYQAAELAAQLSNRETAGELLRAWVAMSQLERCPLTP